MEQMTLLGTGHAMVSKCYHTCFAIRLGETYLLTDTGGGSGILTQLRKAQIPVERIGHIFISHAHTDHILGLPWILRIVLSGISRGQYSGCVHIYAHNTLIQGIQAIGAALFHEAFVRQLGNGIILHSLESGQAVTIAGHRLQCFDVQSPKEKQFGYRLTAPDGKTLVFLGDEGYRPEERPFAENADWLLHEAFCVGTDADSLRLGAMQHSTVAQACRNAAGLGAKNLVLYHTEDSDLPHRREIYTAAGKPYFSGTIYAPEDLETISL